MSTDLKHANLISDELADLFVRLWKEHDVIYAREEIQSIIDAFTKIERQRIARLSGPKS